VREAKPARTSVSRCSRTVLGCSDMVSARLARVIGRSWARNCSRSWLVAAESRRSGDPPRGPNGPGDSEPRDLWPSPFFTVSTVLIPVAPPEWWTSEETSPQHAHWQPDREGPWWEACRPWDGHGSDDSVHLG